MTMRAPARQPDPGHRSHRAKSRCAYDLRHGQAAINDENRRALETRSQVGSQVFEN